MNQILSIGLFLIMNFSLFSQVNNQSILIETLLKNQIGKTITYGKWTQFGGTETQLTFLGVINENGIEYKILNSSWIWGISKRATNRIMLFSNKNEYLGHYYITAKCDLPKRIKNNKLIFEPDKCDDCNHKQTIIDFKKGIPKQLFITCRGSYGSMYIFNTKKIE
ncbi:conserved protein of unknown function [Tenacibaculum sp. 190130A14a]|uniref:Uncharacterized protein n=1 Tax=Tenacibaculum polynesiense TaxID=3137857 RepID=A0ABP1F158_9FLAO